VDVVVLRPGCSPELTWQVAVLLLLLISASSSSIRISMPAIQDIIREYAKHSAYSVGSLSH
jgi:hypothetical protein